MPTWQGLYTAAKVAPERRDRLAADVAAAMAKPELRTEFERRMLAVELVESGRYRAATLADSIGSRIGTIQRLLEEGRRLRRDRAEIAA